MRSIFNIIFVFCFTLSVAAQDAPWNLPKYDCKKLRFGYTLGYTTMDFSIRPSDDFMILDSVYSIENKRLPGFHLGIVSEFHAGKYIDIRFLPGLSFGERDLSYLLYDYDDQMFKVHTMKIESTFLDFPILMKYSSERLNNYRVYVLGGGSIRYDLAAQKEIKPQEMPKIKLKPLDLYYEIGFGIDYFLEYFKFSTEIKMAVGTNNVVVPDGSQFTSSINRMNSRLISISLHFEGGKYDGMRTIMGKIMWWRK